MEPPIAKAKGLRRASLEDPLDHHDAEVVTLFKAAPGIRDAIHEEMMRRYPETEPRHSRPLERRIHSWRGIHGEGRLAALYMIEPRAERPQGITLRGDKAHDFVNDLRSII